MAKSTPPGYLLTPRPTVQTPWRWSIHYGGGPLKASVPLGDKDAYGVLLHSVRVWSGAGGLDWRRLRVVIGSKIYIHSPVWFLRHWGGPLSKPLLIRADTPVIVEILTDSELVPVMAPLIELTGFEISLLEGGHRGR